MEGLFRRTILDEVQRVPEIFTTLKAAIDERRTAGRFILTGSANVLLVPRLADSLAGRMGILRLHPLAPCEVHGKRPRFIETLFRGGFPTRVTHRLWALSMEAVAAGLMAMVFSSYVMGFRLKPKRRWGVIALLLGIVVCGVFLSPALTWVL